jgi:hypothetical protein
MKFVTVFDMSAHCFRPTEKQRFNSYNASPSNSSKSSVERRGYPLLQWRKQEERYLHTAVIDSAFTDLVSYRRLRIVRLGFGIDCAT